jgi:hypothetical protein
MIVTRYLTVLDRRPPMPMKKTLAPLAGLALLHSAAPTGAAGNAEPAELTAAQLDKIAAGLAAIRPSPFFSPLGPTCACICDCKTGKLFHGIDEIRELVGPADAPGTTVPPVVVPAPAGKTPD